MSLKQLTYGPLHYYKFVLILLANLNILFTIRSNSIENLTFFSVSYLKFCKVLRNWNEMNINVDGWMSVSSSAKQDCPRVVVYSIQIQYYYTEIFQRFMFENSSLFLFQRKKIFWHSSISENPQLHSRMVSDSLWYHQTWIESLV